jgi:hypothetical protein
MAGGGDMAFEVPPTAVRSGHPRRWIGLAALVGLVVVVGAVLTRPPVPTRTSSLDPAVITALHLPAQLDCHDLDRSSCEAATRAAIGLFAPSDGAVTAAGAWKSLLCSNTLDCPPTRLTADAEPLGSVIVTFAAGPAAWINVMAHPASIAGGPETVADAWVVRWR